MQAGAQETESLIQIILVIVALIVASKLNALGEKPSDMQSARHDVSTFVRNVVLHAGLFVNGELNSLIDGATEATVVLPGIDVVGIVLGVVDVILRAVGPQTVSRDLELAAAIAEGEEAENAEEEADGFGGDGLDGADIDGLGVVAEPVAEVDARDHHLVELLASHGASHEDGKEGIFNVAMTPCSRAQPCQYRTRHAKPDSTREARRQLTVLALDLGDASDIASSKGKSRTGKEKEDRDPQEDGVGFRVSHGCNYLTAFGCCFHFGLSLSELSGEDNLGMTLFTPPLTRSSGVTEGKRTANCWESTWNRVLK